MMKKTAELNISFDRPSNMVCPPHFFAARLPTHGRKAADLSDNSPALPGLVWESEVCAGPGVLVEDIPDVKGGPAQRQAIIQDFLPHFRRSGHTVYALAQRQTIIQDFLPHFRRSGHVLYMHLLRDHHTRLPTTLQEVRSYCKCTGPETGHHTGLTTTLQEVRSCTVYVHCTGPETGYHTWLPIPHFRRQGHHVCIMYMH